ncbi:MAG TPA: Gx transporter family protein [Clostridiales bacterium]|nr:Gx transporter family protein [Clostridiales bacterium]
MTSPTTKTTAYLGVFVALAFIFSYIEAIIPFSMGVPGIKLGLANIVVLIVLYAFGTKEAFLISLVRIVLIAFTFSNTFTMIYSLSGGFLSWALMSILIKTDKFSIVGVSVVGGVSHNIGQLVIAAILIKTTSLIYYFPILIIGGVITGIIIGLLSARVMLILNRHI